jgi:RsiW-degrading membrane proteinase PrsW (M82 family)
MCVVLLVIPVQKGVQSVGFEGTALLCIWAFIEEIAKFCCAYLAILRSKLVDEPIDPIIYMITIALGFAALENTLFLLNPLSGETIPVTILTGNFRFFGATLLHVLCSSIVGCALTLSFYMHGFKHDIYAIYGVILAGAVHSLFNFFVLQQEGVGILKIFLFVWLGIIALLVFFQYAKRIKAPTAAPLART